MKQQKIDEMLDNIRAKIETPKPDISFAFDDIETVKAAMDLFFNYKFTFEVLVPNDSYKITVHFC